MDFQLTPDIVVPHCGGILYGEIKLFKETDLTWETLAQIALSSLRLRCPEHFGEDATLDRVPAKTIKGYVLWLQEQISAMADEEVPAVEEVKPA